jgi:LPS sulfotransferase NodH
MTPTACGEMVWALCCTARTGSTWVCEMARSTQVLGIPEEYLLNPLDWCVRLGGGPSMLPMQDYIHLLLRTRSKNGTFGIKGSYFELNGFLDYFPMIPCVWLRRRDRVAQAISWYVGNDGDRWSRIDGIAYGRIPPLNIDRIVWFLSKIVEIEKLWQAYFQQRQIIPLTLEYEDVCADPIGSMQRITAHVGVSISFDKIDYQMQQLRDGATAAWLPQLHNDPRVKAILANHCF